MCEFAMFTPPKMALEPNADGVRDEVLQVVHLWPGVPGDEGRKCDQRHLVLPLRRERLPSGVGQYKHSAEPAGARGWVR